MGESTLRNTQMSTLLKTLVCAFYNFETEEISDEPSAKFLPYKYDGQHLDVMRRLVKILMQTDYMNDITKKYLSSTKSTYRSVSEELDINFNTAKSSVWYYMKKVGNDISKSNIFELMYKPKNSVVAIEKQVVQVEMVLYDKEEIWEHLIIKVDKPKINAVISDVDFNTLISTLRPYSKKAVRDNLSELTDDMKGYFWYLMEYDGMLEGKDAENMEVLKEMLGIQ